MIPIKIQCVCGQRYAFDIEPVGNAMPAPVACPVCGADGTAAANALIAEAMAPALPVGPPPVRALRLDTASMPPALQPDMPAPPRPSVRRLPQTDPAKAESEARSKIFWGDPPEDVIKFVMMQGIGYEEACGLVNSIVQERVSMLRGIGIRKTVTGLGLVCVPVAAFIYFTHLGVLPLKLFAITVLVGLYGAYLFIKGTFMLLAPRSEPGDIADK